MENTTFNYNYSAQANNEVESIRRKYMPKEESKLETLKRLDVRAQTAGVVESLCTGVIGSLVFGVGMCFFLKVFSGEAWLTALLMVVGTLIMISAYPLYKRISEKMRAELAPRIIRLSDEIIKS